jgi:hypothetical protein
MRIAPTAAGLAVILLLGMVSLGVSQGKPAFTPASKARPKGKASMTSKATPAKPAASTGTIVCPVSKDAWVYVFRPDRNYGDGLGWKDRTDPTQDLTVPKLFLGFGGTDKKLVLVQFDIAKLPAHQRPKKAVLRMYNDYAGSAAATEVQAKAVTSPWDEAKVTWKTRPQLGDAVSTVTLKNGIDYGQAGIWYEWDVTAIVAAWAGGKPNHGIALDPAGDSGVDRDFVCKEYTQKAEFAPQLVVEYAGTAEAPKE